MGITEPPDRGTPYPEGAEPYEPAEGEEIEVVEVEYSTDTERKGVAPFVVAVGAGVVASLIVEGGKYVMPKAWDAVTKEPVLDFTRPPTVYSPATGLVYRLEGSYYVPAGPASMS